MSYLAYFLLLLSLFFSANSANSANETNTKTYNFGGKGDKQTTNTLLCAKGVSRWQAETEDNQTIPDHCSCATITNVELIKKCTSNYNSCIGACRGTDWSPQCFDEAGIKKDAFCHSGCTHGKNSNFVFPKDDKATRFNACLNNPDSYNIIITRTDLCDKDQACAQPIAQAFQAALDFCKARKTRAETCCNDPIQCLDSNSQANVQSILSSVNNSNSNGTVETCSKLSSLLEDTSDLESRLSQLCTNSANNCKTTCAPYITTARQKFYNVCGVHLIKKPGSFYPKCTKKLIKHYFTAFNQFSTIPQSCQTTSDTKSSNYLGRVQQMSSTLLNANNCIKGAGEQIAQTQEEEEEEPAPAPAPEENPPPATPTKTVTEEETTISIVQEEAGAETPAETNDEQAQQNPLATEQTEQTTEEKTTETTEEDTSNTPKQSTKQHSGLRDYNDGFDPNTRQGRQAYIDYLNEESEKKEAHRLKNQSGKNKRRFGKRKKKRLYGNSRTGANRTVSSTKKTNRIFIHPPHVDLFERVTIVHQKMCRENRLTDCS